MRERCALASSKMASQLAWTFLVSIPMADADVKSDALQRALRRFVQQDAARRSGTAEGTKAAQALEDRLREGELIARLVPAPLEPLALPLLALAGGGFELAKASGINQFLPGPLGADETTSPASLDNFLAALEGFRRGATLLGEGGGEAKGMPGVRVPTELALQGFQGGGLVGNVIDRLGNIRADTGRLEGIAGQLGQFNPFAGGLGTTAQNTLSSLLGTGAPVDVSGITDVAQQRAGRSFEDFLQGSNEQLGALGLGSSSSRDAIQAREAARLAQGVGETGILSQVGAQEAARGRQLGAFSPFLGATGQQLGALGTAGGLFGQAAGLGLEAQLGPLGPLTGLTGQLLGQQGRELQQPQAPNPLQGPINPNPFLMGGGGFQGPGGRGGFGGGFGGGRRGGASGGSIRNVLGFQRGGEVEKGRKSATGGQKKDFGDFLSNLLFGQEFERRAPVDTSGGFGGGFGRRTPTRGFRGTSFNPATRRFTPGIDTPQRGGRPLDILSLLSNIGQQRAGMFGQSAGAAPFDAAALGAGPLGGGQLFMPFLRQGGGVIPGPAVPPDTVPILAQGGEGVIPVQLMAELREAGSDPKQLAAVAAKIQALMQDVDKASETGKQDGGLVTERAAQDPQSIIDFMGPVTDEQRAGGAAGGTLSFLGQPPEEKTPQQQFFEELENQRRRLGLLQAAATLGPRGAQVNQMVQPQAELVANLERTGGFIQQAELEKQAREAQAQATVEAATIRGETAEKVAGAEAGAAAQQEQITDEQIDALLANPENIQTILSADPALGGVSVLRNMIQKRLAERIMQGDQRALEQLQILAGFENQVEGAQ